MNKYFLIVGFMVIAGCSNEVVVERGSVMWVSVGTLVSVGPDMESTHRPSRLGSAMLGETKLNRTRVETTEGVYIVSDKIGLVETGIPVSIGYDTSDEYPDAPSYLAFRGERYEIVR